MTTITLDITLFRARFPQFASSITFTDVYLDMQWIVACQYISDENYGCLVDQARELALQYMLAHLMGLFVLIGTSGQGQAGIVTGAGIDKVNVSLATPPYGTSEWRYWLNLTPYGTMLLALLQAQSVGGFYYGGQPDRAAFRGAAGGFYRG